MTQDATADFLVARTGGILRLRLNRPDHGNAIASESVPALTELFRDARIDPQVRCLVIEGAGKHFCSGGDVAGFGRDLDRSREERQADFRARLDRVAGLIVAITAFDRPIIAAVHGVVAGAGLMLTLCADLVVGDETSQFMFSHRRIGLSPDGGVSYFLPRIVGRRVAARLILTAARVGADEALSIGLLSEQSPSEALSARVTTIAEQFAKSPQQAVQFAKSLLRRSDSNTLSQQLEAERDAIAELVASADFEEGVRAFMGKRNPMFPSCEAAD